MQIQERLTAFAMLGATWVLWLLVCLSVFGMAVIIERLYMLFASRGNLSEMKTELLRWLGRNEYETAKQQLQSSGTFEGRIVAAGLDAASQGAAAVEERLASEAMLSRIQMEKNLAFLGTIGNNAPFIGLLGTVIGIIRAFHALNESAGQVNSKLMSEVGEALVATAVGILVALPAVAFFNLFQRMIKTRLGQADALGREVLAHLKSTQPTVASK